MSLILIVVDKLEIPYSGQCVAFQIIILEIIGRRGFIII